MRRAGHGRGAWARGSRPGTATWRGEASSRRLPIALWLLAAALFAVFVWLAVASGPGSALSAWDGRVTDAFLAWRTPGRSRLFWAATLIGNNPVLAALSFSAVMLFAVWGRRGRAALVAVGLLMGWGISEGAKAVVGRIRPPAADALIAVPGSHSMPSGHALTSVVFFGVLLYAAFRWGGPRGAAPAGGRRTGIAWGPLLVAAAVAGLIGVSRVYLGVHWLSDVLGGWCLAGAWLIIFLIVVRSRTCAGGSARAVRLFLARHAPAGHAVRGAAVVFALLLCLAAVIVSAIGDPLLSHL